MKPSREIDCIFARGALSARLDAELADERPLLAHLEHCEPCRRHERGLAELARGWQALRTAAPLPPADLWRRIERARERRPRRARLHARPALANAAAGLIGFLGLGLGARWLEGARAGAAHDHWLERLAPEVLDRDPAALVAERPELRLLRAFPNTSASEDRR